MNMNLVFTKTAVGEEAVRQSTRLVQRNLRMVLVQVDGKLSVADLAAKIGNASLVTAALKKLEAGGFVLQTDVVLPAANESATASSAVSQAPDSQLFSRFGELPAARIGLPSENLPASTFSIFGKPILPAEGAVAEKSLVMPKTDAALAKEPAASSFSLKKLGLASFGLFLVLILGVLLFPYEYFRPEVESALSRLLHRPAHVGALSLSLLPSPALVLSDLKVGDAAEVQVAKIRLSSPLSLLTSGLQGVGRVEMSGVSIPVDQLLALPGLLNPAQISLHQLLIKQLTLRAGELAIHDLAGSIDFSLAGQLEKMNFQTVDRSLHLDIQPTAQGLAVVVDGYGWRPDATSTLIFDSIQAKGFVQTGKLVLQHFDAAILGGVLKGSWMLDWRNGLAMAGDASLARLDARRVASAFAPSMKLEGEVGGSLRWRGQGADWATLLNSLDIGLDLEMQRGAFNGVDIGEAMRRGQGVVVRSGSTRFDHLRADVVIAPRQITAKHIQLTAGMMSAQGELLAQGGGQVDGNFVVSMQSSVSTQRVPVSVSGILPNLVAVSTAGRNGGN